MKSSGATFFYMEKITVPTQIIDEAKCRTNIRNMFQKATNSGAVLRPHFKTHQALHTGRLFREEGIDRIAVSSVSMAAYFAADGWDDIMVAFPVNIREAAQINRLAQQIRLGILVSSPGVVPLLKEQITRQVDLYLKIDVGTHRTGFHPDDLKVIEKELLQIKDHELLHFKGFVAHAGHTYQALSREQIISISHEGVDTLKRLKVHFLGSFPDCVISWGDTPSCSIIPSFEGVDELRPGNFVYYDLMQRYLGACTPDDIAMVVAAPVVALHPEREEVVVYAGAVHLSKEQLVLPEGQTCYGMMVAMEENGRWHLLPQQVFVVRVSQEHGILKVPVSMMNDFAVGQLVGIIPVHACLAADLLKDHLRLV